MAIRAIKVNNGTEEIIAENTITESSDYPVSSGAVHEAIEELRSEITTVDYNHAVDGGAW